MISTQVVRHGDRTPKRKLKVKTSALPLVALHRERAKSAKKEVKIKESKDLKAFADLLGDVLASADAASKTGKNLAKLADVLRSHIGHAGGAETPTALNMALFSGCKLQVKPSAWSGDDQKDVSEVMLVLKWGGVLTELGVEHATALGAHFRRHVYPASEDGAGLLRLPVWKSTTGLGGPHQTSELSISVKSKSIRLIFGRIDSSSRVLEARPESLRQNCRICAH